MHWLMELKTLTLLMLMYITISLVILLWGLGYKKNLMEKEGFKEDT